jgi:hypothetical protein
MDRDPLIERRRHVRRAPGSHEPVCRVRLRTGRELSVVDVSNDGALVEGARLLPGTHLDVHVTTHEGRILVRSRVVRAFVVSLQADAVRYRGALAFDRSIDTSLRLGYPMPSGDRATGDAQGSAYPHGTVLLLPPIDDRLTA